MLSTKVNSNCKHNKINITHRETCRLPNHTSVSSKLPFLFRTTGRTGLLTGRFVTFILVFVLFPSNQHCHTNIVQSLNLQIVGRGHSIWTKSSQSFCNQFLFDLPRQLSRFYRIHDRQKYTLIITVPVNPFSQTLREFNNIFQ